MQWNVLDDLAEDHEGVGRIKKDSLIRFVQFRRHVRLTPIVSKTILVILSFFVLWLRPLFCLVRCFLCWRNANLAGIFACRRCVASFLFVSSSPWICLVVWSQNVSYLLQFLNRFSHCRDRALERNRPQQRKKRIDAPREERGHVIDRKKITFMTDQNTFCAIGCRCYCVACFQWELHHCTCRSRLAGPARCDVVIFASAVAADGAHVSVINLCFWKKYLHDSRSFLLFCQAPTSSPSSSRPCRRSARGKNERACGPTIQTYINTYVHIYYIIYICIHTSIHTYIHTCIHTYIHTYMHTCIHAYMHTCIHAYNTTCPYATYSYLPFHTQLAPRQSFTISFPFHAFPMPSLPYFCCLLEEVDMWGCPVL